MYNLEREFGLKRKEVSLCGVCDKAISNIAMGMVNTDSFKILHKVSCDDGTGGWIELNKISGNRGVVEVLGLIINPDGSNNGKSKESWFTLLGKLYTHNFKNADDAYTNMALRFHQIMEVDEEQSDALTIIYREKI